MKKFFKCVLAIILSFVLVLPIFGCNQQNNQVVTVKCAPCNIQDIYFFNEECWKTFFPLKVSTHHNRGLFPITTINGEECTTPQRLTDLEEGEYTIKFYTDENYFVNKVENNGGSIEYKKIPIIRSLTLKVSISSSYDDIYDPEYRKANGLWLDPEQQDWYDDCLKEYEAL